MVTQEEFKELVVLNTEGSHDILPNLGHKEMPARSSSAKLKLLPVILFPIGKGCVCE